MGRASDAALHSLRRGLPPEADSLTISGAVLELCLAGPLRFVPVSRPGRVREAVCPASPLMMLRRGGAPSLGRRRLHCVILRQTYEFLDATP
jgi:hypothetical protein